jgi:hypothetical protein
MMKLRVLLLLLTLLMAACAPAAPTPTATTAPTPLPPTETLIPTETPAPAVVQAQTSVAPVIPPGTLVTPQSLGVTETPPPAFDFTLIEYTQTGGLVGGTLRITLDGEGSLDRNGVTSTISPEKVEEIRAALEGISFFSLQGMFEGIAPANAYSYSLRVEGSRGVRTIRATEGFIPDALQAVFNLIGTLGI